MFQQGSFTMQRGENQIKLFFSEKKNVEREIPPKIIHAQQQFLMS